MTATADQRDPSGFTLIEVVVALGLGVLLTVAVQALLVQAYRVSAELEQRQNEALDRVLPLELLEQDLANLPAGGGVTLQDGRLLFTSANAMQAAETTARHAVAVCYHAQRSMEQSWHLVRTERELGDESPADAGVVLARGLETVQIEVFDGQSWHNSWPLAVSQAALALRVALGWRDGHGERRTLRLAPLHWRRHDE